MISRQARITRALTRVFAKPLLKPFVPVKIQRVVTEQAIGRWPVANGVTAAPETLGGCSGTWFAPEQSLGEQVILYFHGGAYCIGSSKSHRNLISHLARYAATPCFAPDYQLAPECVFPAAVDDAVAAYQGLLDRGYRPERIAIAGDSAGGGLSLALMLALKDKGLPLPAAACLISPWVDMTGTSETLVTHKKRDPMLSPGWITVAREQYMQAQDIRQPLASPLFADLSGLPPLFIQVASEEVLLDDARQLKAAAEQAGVQVEYTHWEGMWHVFQLLGGVVPEADESLQAMAEFCQRHWGEAQPA